MEKLKIRERKRVTDYGTLIRLRKETAEKVAEVSEISGVSQVETIKILLDYAFENIEYIPWNYEENGSIKSEER